MAIKIKMEQIKDSANKKLDGRWRARRVGNGETNTEKLVAELSRHGWPQGVVEGILTDLGDVIRRELLEGKTVAVDGFGRFHIAISSDVVDSPEMFRPGKNIRKFTCRFVAQGQRGMSRKIVYDWMKDAKAEFASGKKLKKTDKFSRQN
jgi:predicted histone-like DNA-binding protein